MVGEPHTKDEQGYLWPVHRLVNLGEDGDRNHVISYRPVRPAGHVPRHNEGGFPVHHADTTRGWWRGARCWRDNEGVTHKINSQSAKIVSTWLNIQYNISYFW